MASKTQEENRLAQYLLGGLPERERERLEAEYLEDDDAFEQMLIAEEELTDAYVRRELSAEDRARFEKSYLSSPRGCERVQFARALAGAVSDARGAETTEAADGPGRSLFAAVRARAAAWRFAFAAAALVAAVSLAWLLVERARVREELQQLRAERASLIEKAQELERGIAGERARNAEMLAQLEAERARPTPEPGRQGAEAVAQQRPPRATHQLAGPLKKSDKEIARRAPGPAHKSPPPKTMDATLGTIFKPRRIDELPRRDQTASGPRGGVSFSLMPGLVRGGGPKTLTVLDKAGVVLLKLNLETESSHENYSAVIETADRRPVWRADAVKPSRPISAGGTIDLAVPARDLPPGDYVLFLSGTRPDGSSKRVADYSFRVVRK